MPSAVATHLRTAISSILSRSPLAYWPVRVRKGPARGARWTLLPFSSNWRNGGEADLEAGLAALGRTAGAVCWDFGAHFGIHTVGMSLQVGQDGHVVAFEPDAVAFRRLELHVRRNHLRNVTLIPAAASSEAGQVQLILQRGLGSTFSHLRYPDEPRPAMSDVVIVEAVSPDDLVTTGRIPPPDLIKVDVQGHGAAALRGSSESIARRRPVIVFSGHGAHEATGVREVLEPLGYVARGLSGAQMSWESLATEPGVLTCLQSGIEGGN